MLGRIADLTWGRPKLVLAVVGVFVVLAGAMGHDVEHHLKAAGFTDSSSESERATKLLREQLGYDANAGLVVLLRARDGGRLDLKRPEVAREVTRLRRDLGAVKFIGRVEPPLAARDGRSVVIAGHLATQDIENDGGDAAEEAKRRVRSQRLTVSFGGFAPSFDETADQTREDLTKAELIAFPLLTLLLLIVFRGVVAAGIPLLIGVIAILGTFLALRLMATVVDTSIFALNIATALSLGLAVDYALLLVTRFREEIERDGGATREAHRRTVITAGRTAFFSGLTVAASMAGLLLMPQRFLYSIAAAGAVVGMLSAVIAVLVVPSLLSLLGPRINALSIRRGHAVSQESDGWYRVARGVMRRPVLVAVTSAAVLLASGAPLLGTVLTGPSAQAVPPSKPSFQANAYVEQRYGRAVSEAITVTVRGGADLRGLHREIAAIDGIAGGTPFVRAGDVAYANFAPATFALARRTQDAVDSIRALPADVLVSGNTARFMDQKQSLRDHMPRVIAVVAAVTLLLLFLLTGSVILPLKTLVMNGLTLAATLGIVVLSFQKGWLSGLFDYTGPDAVEVTTLVLLFAIVFGLATDYAVLVMARIKEQHDLGMSNEEAVAIGIARTGRVITAAALMIAVVFLAFGVSKVFFMKQAAVGQAIGVLIDATIVRALLVPSLMRLFGEWNWWAPRPLARFQARYGVHD
jgi:RND superfamily putative drug exporter